jgi:hypothetical protein
LPHLRQSRGPLRLGLLFAIELLITRSLLRLRALQGQLLLGNPRILPRLLRRTRRLLQGEFGLLFTHQAGLDQLIAQ